jgi:hypothetical protein
MRGDEVVTKINGRLRKRGFSLMAVLIISVLGLAIVGATLQIVVSSSGAGRASSAASVKYNLLQNAVEEGKSALRSSMDNLDPPLRYENYASTPTPVLHSADDLLVNKDFGTGAKGIAKTTNLSKFDLGRLGITGNGGTLTVAIYDMQYPPNKIDPSLTDLEIINRIPPSIELTAASNWHVGESYQSHKERKDDNSAFVENNGVYLVRAELTLFNKNRPPEVTVLDTAVIQSNNMVN